MKPHRDSPVPVAHGESSDYLTRLTSPTLENILSTVRKRYQNGDYFTKLGENALLVLGGSGVLAESTAEVAAEYARWVIDMSPNKRDLPPHVFDLAASCFYHMTRDHRNQSVVFLGDDASEKSEIRKLFVWQLMMLSTTTDDVNDQKILRAATLMDPVFEAFAHARTLRSRSATLVCKYVEYQYDHNWKLVGVGSIAYHLDKSRFASSTPFKEENYPVFYYLLAGSTALERNRWKLGDASSFRYLQGSPFFHTPDDDCKLYNELQKALKHLRIGLKLQKQISQVLAAVLHLGNVTFVDDDTRPQDSCSVANYEALCTAADLLGVHPQNLEDAVIYKSKVIGNERISMFLTSEGAAAQRDLLASTIYSELVAWLVRKMNACLCKNYEDEIAASIRVLEIPSFRKDGHNELDRLLYNMLNEQLHFHMSSWIQDRSIDYAHEGVLSFAVENQENQSAALAHLLSFDAGLLHLIDEESVRRFLEGSPDAGIPRGMIETYEHLSPVIVDGVPINNRTFQIQHYNGETAYDINKLVEKNGDVLSSAVASLFVGSAGVHPCANGFVRNLFSHSDGYGESENYYDDKTVISKFSETTSQVISAIKDAAPWFVLCVDSGESPVSDKMDVAILKADLVNHQVTNHVQTRVAGDYVADYTHEDFISRFHAVVLNKPLEQDDEVDFGSLCEEFASEMGWSEEHMALGLSRVFLSEKAWRILHDRLRAFEEENHQTTWNAHTSQFVENFARPFPDNGDTESDVDMGTSTDVDVKYVTRVEKEALAAEAEKEEKRPVSSARKRWLCCTWTLTWWIPSCCISKVGRMPRKDVQMAWREKVALCMIIGLMCIALLAFIIGLPRIICPKQKVLSLDEIRKRTDADDPWVYGYGKAYQIKDLYRGHMNVGADMSKYQQTYGKDISGMFYKTDYFNDMCPGVASRPSPAWDNIVKRPLDASLAHRTTDRPYFQTLSHLAKFDVAFKWDYIQQQPLLNKTWIVLFDKIYDVTTYTSDPFFQNSAIDRIFQATQGADATNDWVSSVVRADPGGAKAIMNCMNNMFYIGVVDHRLDIGCQFSNYILLASSMIVIGIIGMKFLVAVQFTSPPKVDKAELNRFVICQMPCYTEGEASLRKSLQSLACMDYDDARKLLFIICDGMVVGSGNTRATPRIVLDILGVDPKYDPEPLLFQSVGEGDMQLNRAKVYSGLYTVKQGPTEHVVPFIVVVKVGKESEVARPGNRGKRDSQLLLMKFLSRVHFDAEMEPLELELYRTMADVVGIHPSMYELIFMVDADTEVFPDSLGQMVHSMIHDTSIIGLCGETILANRSDTWITKIQVYEYFISHHLTKAFEAIFGAVTCLPGCFCVYRIRSPKNVPLLISPEVIDDFKENRIDTLHMKNLFHLGEDRFLTTLVIKWFPHMRTTFISHAKCKTSAPDKWRVLSSQRRRWINSTVHNLFELLFIRRLCGFLCCSMRFVVFLDLLSTLIQPAAILYIAYLVYALVSAENGFPIISIALLAAIYGLQVIVFLLKRQWRQVLWMVIYIFAIPVFTFYLPLYAFWHFDDFSWGNTRVVYGEDGRKTTMVADVGMFDPTSIPKRKWGEYSKEKLVQESDAKREREQTEKRRLSHRVMSMTASNVRSSIMSPVPKMSPRSESPPEYNTGSRPSTPSLAPVGAPRSRSPVVFEYVSKSPSRAGSPRPVTPPTYGHMQKGSDSSTSSESGRAQATLEQALARYNNGPHNDSVAMNPPAATSRYSMANYATPSQQNYRPPADMRANNNTDMVPVESTEIRAPEMSSTVRRQSPIPLGDNRSPDASFDSYPAKRQSPVLRLDIRLPEGGFPTGTNVGPQSPVLRASIIPDSFDSGNPRPASTVSPVPRDVRLSESIVQNPPMKSTGATQGYHDSVLPEQRRTLTRTAVDQRFSEISGPGNDKGRDVHTGFPNPALRRRASDISLSGSERNRSQYSAPSTADGRLSQMSMSGGAYRPPFAMPPLAERRASQLSIGTMGTVKSALAMPHVVERRASEPHIATSVRPQFPMPHPMERRASELSIGGLIRRRDRAALAEVNYASEMEQVSRPPSSAAGDVVVNQFPSDQLIISEVRRIVERSDLMTISKKTIRELLGQLFRVDLSAKKQLISDVVDELLDNMLHNTQQ
ncbi:uncharacterized protein SPPG_03441 [Spizellomyces punctatus DAOM BR117]|uniref:chitin synthase n=1 Tax=Spizellomyces punctatus (strain DAOM BR117) TaxID=645134 RepID=A0A0L0HLG5_SPIPD|nr:uncharacterized protein SPPG_03441 [Spizellomyces punctatus DAOM BR117]KND01644.1 hypothetical protein SPPG_03441 [Spizellomyces punctatus DAOM BR117]|eukprot:XP_016609683.1 hypothetical protein SPPG_03441 [Spizellomyces punctatus DAOM BR117]